MGDAVSFLSFFLASVPVSATVSSLRPVVAITVGIEIAALSVWNDDWK